MRLSLLALVFSINAMASPQDVAQEALFDQFIKDPTSAISALEGPRILAEPQSMGLFFKAAQVLSGYPSKHEGLLAAIDGLQELSLELHTQIRLAHLKFQLGEPVNTLSLEVELSRSYLDRPTALAIFDLWQELPGEHWRSLLNQAKAQYPESYQQYAQTKTRKFPSAKALQDLFKLEPNIRKYKNGMYYKKPRLYMFCRKDRRYHCLKLLKDKNGQVHKVADQTWSQPSLGYSRKKLPSYKFNGNTPAGIWRINGVMPEANKKLRFGKFRRLILNFVAKSENEKDQKLLIPASSHNESWWHPAIVARDIGRGLFRIHGTGMAVGENRPYYPFVPTIGCVAQREGFKDKTYYKDQRFLLDTLMRASQLEPVFENETKLLGLLYVVDINDEKRAVTLEDLQNLGLI